MDEGHADVTVTLSGEVTVRGDGGELFPPLYVYTDCPYACFLEFGTQPSEKKPLRTGRPSKHAFSEYTNRMTSESWTQVSPAVRNIAEWLRTKNMDRYRRSNSYVSARGKGGREKSMKAGLNSRILYSEKELHRRANAIFSKMMREGMPPHPFFRAGMIKAQAGIQNSSSKPDTLGKLGEHMVRSIQAEISSAASNHDALWNTMELYESIKYRIGEPPEGSAIDGNPHNELWNAENAKRGLGKWSRAEYEPSGKRV